MALILGKTVYILGAGASAHSGAPLLNDFMKVAKRIYLEKGNLLYAKSFERISEWQDKLRKTSHYMDINLENIEHIFSLAEMGKQIGLKEETEYCSDLKHIIMETLDHSCAVHFNDNENKYELDRTYSLFVRNLIDFNNKRKDRLKERPGQFEYDAIITFNYDVMLDNAMFHISPPVNYCLGGLTENDDSRVKLIKLHGSLNWATHKGCSDDIQIINPDPIPENVDIHFPRAPRLQTFKMATYLLSNSKCKKCGKISHKNSELEPFIIPPTWSKAIGGTQISKVWQTAVQEIQTAEQLVIIGYSMPPTDTFFQYLITLGIEKNRNLDRVMVVDRNGNEEFKARYTTLFRRFSERDKIEFITVPFDGFISLMPLVDKIP